ncbi:hypothetical protein BO86DRAFT_147053 [Aspergillus japonicus CBS 114.51]|uniref:Uncharacterized protein n=1 Tax=Aspergillus japonicus CBS 114.51 TaxID=1448312 RepID=A0A8T8WV82_ASPJA|nr:hypothetical protein BO86DRAFT_147053 [Aspergillus japonicus CBS 114.51]RAH79758.1 hypothetical protein BO86DRAFT_147053 [Aspergillus japonicus CBS 114.51]
MVFVNTLQLVFQLCGVLLLFSLSGCGFAVTDVRCTLGRSSSAHFPFLVHIYYHLPIDLSLFVFTGLECDGKGLGFFFFFFIFDIGCLRVHIIISGGAAHFTSHPAELSRILFDS